MKKIYLSIILLTSFVHYCNAQFFFQYFDGADTSYSNSVMIQLDPDSNNIWQIGPPQKTFFNSASTLPNAIITDTINNYPASNTSRFITKAYNNFGPAGVFALQWRQKLDMDTAHSGGIVEFTTDHGATWQNAFNNPYTYNFYGFNQMNQDTLNTGEYAFSGRDTTWRDIWLCFDLAWMTSWNDTIMFRFTFKSDSLSSNKEGWMIDNILAHPTFIHAVKVMGNTDYINVFPNPASNIVHVETEKILAYHIIEHMQLFDAQGNLVEHWEFIPTKFWFDVSKYKAGQYYLKVQTNLKTETIPLIVVEH